MKDEINYWWIGNNDECDISGKPCINDTGCSACEVRKIVIPFQSRNRTVK